MSKIKPVFFVVLALGAALGSYAYVYRSTSNTLPPTATPAASERFGQEIKP